MKYQSHSGTSFEAAAQIEPSTNTLRGVVLAFIRKCGREGATDEQIQLALSMNPSTQRPRRIELVEQRWIVDSGRVAKTRSGRSAVVWVGREFVEREPAKQMEFSL